MSNRKVGLNGLKPERCAILLSFFDSAVTRNFKILFNRKSKVFSPESFAEGRTISKASDVDVKLNKYSVVQQVYNIHCARVSGLDTHVHNENLSVRKNRKTLLNIRFDDNVGDTTCCALNLIIHEKT
jgi:hypothetical protein